MRYLDAASSGLLESLDARGTPAVVVTLNDPDETLILVEALCEQYPDVAIFAQGHDLKTCQSLSKLGVSGALSANVMTGLELSRMAMEQAGVKKENVEKILKRYYRQYQALVDPQPSPRNERFDRFRGQK